MKRALIGGVTLLALIAGGCKRVDEAATAPVTLTAVKTIYSFAPCPTPKGEVQGVINIVVPNNFNKNEIDRKVRTKKQKNPNSQDPSPNGTDNRPAKGTPPFDVFLDYEAGFGPADKGLILVRVLLLNGNPGESRLKFHRKAGFRGVGLTDPKFAEMICGDTTTYQAPARPNPPEGDAREIAYFYINLDKFDWRDLTLTIPFVIGIEFPGIADNPVFIDPKIRNDGGCCRAGPRPPTG